MQITCPICQRSVPGEQINMSTDLAYCLDCQKAFQISKQYNTSDIPPDILDHPPKGITFRKTMDSVIIESTTRSGGAFIFIPFTIVWAGGSMGMIYGSQIISGNFDLKASLFGIPFLLGSIFLITMCLMSVFGKIKIEIGRTSSAFVGIGSLGWKKTFDWNDIHKIEEYHTTGKNHNTSIKCSGRTHFTFGSMLSNTRRLYLIDALNYLKAQSRH